MSSVALVGALSDETFRHTVVRLRERGIPFVTIDLTQLLFDRGGRVDESAGVVYVKGQAIDVLSHRAIFNRLSPQIPVGRHLTVRRQLLLRSISRILLHAKRCGSLVVNCPQYMDVNSSKYLQAVNLQRAGFRIPRSLLTNATEAVKRFSRTQPTIFKSCSGERSIVEDVSVLGAGAFLNLRRSPTLFQERIVGADVRVHAVGSSMFGEWIESASVDYRYGRDNMHRLVDVPVSVVTRLKRYMTMNGLHFVGADFKVNSKGHWFILEVNTMPGYSGYDERAKFAISNELCAYLTTETKFAKTTKV
jgi:hypothetical protein